LALDDQDTHMTLDEVLKGLTEGFKGVLGVSVKHLGTGESANLNGDTLFPTASVFKVPVLVEFYRQAERGALSLDQQVILTERDKVPGSGVLKELSEGLSVSLRDLLSLMMMVSDNTATDLIVGKVGFDNVNATLDELGLHRTKVVRYCREILFDLVGVNDLPLEEMTIGLFGEASEAREYGGSWSLGVEENDITTPNEMNRLLEMIVNGEAASRESCDEILAIMGKCQTGQYRIPKYLPTKEVVLQRKTGSLPGIRNDVAVVTVKETGERYVISCFTMVAEDVYEAEETIATVSKGVYEYFTG
jgi:beta-lactamase class A